MARSIKKGPFVDAPLLKAITDMNAKSEKLVIAVFPHDPSGPCWSFIHRSALATDFLVASSIFTRSLTGAAAGGTAGAWAAT